MTSNKKLMELEKKINSLLYPFVYEEVERAISYKIDDKWTAGAIRETLLWVLSKIKEIKE